MNEALKRLYDLQEIDSEIHAAKRALAALDDGAATKKLLRQLESATADLTDKLRGQEAELKDAELNLKTVEGKKQNYERKMYAGEVTNPKELESMEKEIAMLGRNRDTLETRILEILEVVEDQRKTVSAAEARIAQLKEQLAAKVDAYQKKSAELSLRIEKGNAEREAVAAKVEERLLRRYEQIRAHTSGIAVGFVEDGRCGVCHVALTPYAQRLLKESEEPPVCESCGRMLLASE